MSSFLIELRREPGYELRLSVRFSVRRGLGVLALPSRGRDDEPPGQYHEEGDIQADVLRGGRFVHQLSDTQRQSYSFSRMQSDLLASLPDDRYIELQAKTEFGFRYILLPETLPPVATTVAIAIPGARPRINPVKVSPQPALPREDGVVPPEGSPRSLMDRVGDRLTPPSGTPTISKELLAAALGVTPPGAPARVGGTLGGEAVSEHDDASLFEASIGGHGLDSVPAGTGGGTMVTDGPPPGMGGTPPLNSFLRDSPILGQPGLPPNLSVSPSTPVSRSRDTSPGVFMGEPDVDGPAFPPRKGRPVDRLGAHEERMLSASDALALLHEQIEQNHALHAHIERLERQLTERATRERELMLVLQAWQARLPGL